MPRAVILARCQFSLNQPRESPWTARSTTFRPRCRSRRRRGPSRMQCLPYGKSSYRRGWVTGGARARHPMPGGPRCGSPGFGLTDPEPCTWPRWPPWPGATRTRWRRTSRWSAPGPRRSRCAPASSQLALELGGVDGVAAVVAGAVGDPVEVLGVAAHRLQDHAQDRDVVLLAICADEVGLPHPALGEDVPDGRGVVLGGSSRGRSRRGRRAWVGRRRRCWVICLGMNFSTCW